MADDFAFQQQVGVGIELPTERRREEHTLAIHVIAEAVVVLDGQVDPRQHLALRVEGGIDVQRSAVAIPAAGAGLQGAEGFWLGFLGDDVDRAAGIAAPVKAGGRPLEYLDAFDIGGIWSAWVAAVGGETVLVELRGGEAAHTVLIKRQAAEIVLFRDAAGKLQRPLDVVAAQVLEDAGGDHADGLGDITSGRVGFGRTGRASRAIALDRSCGGLVLGADADGVQFQRAGFFGKCRIPQQAECKACQGSGFSRRHEIVPIVILEQYNIADESACF
ncbi:hypothetical protein D3C84_430260 [compost metagenome]